MSQHCALEAKATNNKQGYVSKTAASIPRIISLYLAFVRQSLEYCIQFSTFRDKKGLGELEHVGGQSTCRGAAGPW